MAARQVRVISALIAVSTVSRVELWMPIAHPEINQPQTMSRLLPVERCSTVGRPSSHLTRLGPN